MDVDATQRLIQDFVSVCAEVFGAEHIEAIVQHGSSVKGGAIARYSDIDFQVYLTPDCFNERTELPDERVFAFQERFSALPWSTTGFGYAQVYFHDWRRPHQDWVGPVPGSYRVLLGELPAVVIPTAEQMRGASLRQLKETLPPRLASQVQNFVDSTSEQLARRIRLLGTDVSPAILALAAVEAADPLAVWALSKFEALAILEERYPGEDGPGLAHAFYDRVATLFGGDFDTALARETFKTGVSFLRWVELKARDLQQAPR